MTEHILTVILKAAHELKVFVNSSHADSLMSFLESHGVILSAKADDPVVMTTFHRNGSGTADDYVLAYEFTAISTIEEFSGFIDRWKDGG